MTRSSTYNNMPIGPFRPFQRNKEESELEISNPILHNRCVILEFQACGACLRPESNFFSQNIANLFNSNWNREGWTIVFRRLLLHNCILHFYSFGFRRKLVEPYMIRPCCQIPKDELTGSQTRVGKRKTQEGRDNTFPDTKDRENCECNRIDQNKLTHTVHRTQQYLVID